MQYLGYALRTLLLFMEPRWCSLRQALRRKEREDKRKMI